MARANPASSSQSWRRIACTRSAGIARSPGNRTSSVSPSAAYECLTLEFNSRLGQGFCMICVEYMRCKSWTWRPRLLSLDIKPAVNDRLVDHPFGPSQLTDVGLIAERPSQRAIRLQSAHSPQRLSTSIELMAFTLQRAIEASKRPLATAVKASIETYGVRNNRTYGVRNPSCSVRLPCSGSLLRRRSWRVELAVSIDGHLWAKQLQDLNLDRIAVRECRQLAIDVNCRSSASPSASEKTRR